MIQLPEAWADEHPFFLLVVDYRSGAPIPVVIDTGISGWATTYADLMRAAPAKWYLVSKFHQQAVAALAVNPGDQPFYRARHVGIAGSRIAEITTYGLGKKRADGAEQSVWLLPTGIVCGGDDVYEFGIDLVQQMGPRREGS
jgi:hypothetical protein